MTGESELIMELYKILVYICPFLQKKAVQCHLQLGLHSSTQHCSIECAVLNSSIRKSYYALDVRYCMSLIILLGQETSFRRSKRTVIETVLKAFYMYMFFCYTYI